MNERREELKKRLRSRKRDYASVLDRIYASRERDATDETKREHKNVASAYLREYVSNGNSPEQIKVVKDFCKGLMKKFDEEI